MYLDKRTLTYYSFMSFNYITKRNYDNSYINNNIQ